MFNSGNEWDADGNLAHDGHFKDSEAQAVEKNLAKMREAIEKKEACKSSLDAAFRLRAINDLRRYEFFLENADVIASSIHWYETDEYRIHYCTLSSLERYMSPYGPIHKAPANISPEWRDAIFEWIDSLMPPCAVTGEYWTTKTTGYPRRGSREASAASGTNCIGCGGSTHLPPTSTRTRR